MKEKIDKKKREKNKIITIAVKKRKRK